MRMVLGAIFLLVGSALAATEPLGLKGLAVGSSQGELLKHYPKADCKLKFVCFLSSRGADPKTLTVAGVPVPSMMFLFREDRLERIEMWPETHQFDRLARALQDRYGAPKSDKVGSIRTKTGVQYQNRTLIWSQPDGVIRLERYAGKLYDSFLSFTSHEAIARQHQGS